MSIVQVSAIYEPYYNTNNNQYRDCTRSEFLIKFGECCSCPCRMGTIHESNPMIWKQFVTHTKSQKHVKWISDLSVMNKLTPNQLKEEIKQLKVINTRL